MTEIRQTRDALSRESGITVPVAGLIVFVNPRSLSRKAAVGDPDVELRVLRDSELLSTIRTRRIFSDEQVALIADAACDPGTWLRNPMPSTIGHHIRREYEALEQALEPAMGRAAPVAVGAPRPHTAARPARAAGRTARPKTRNRKGRRSRLDKLIAELVPLVVVFGGLWYYFTFVFGK
jgi:hypothetical protein